MTFRRHNSGKEHPMTRATSTTRSLITAVALLAATCLTVPGTAHATVLVVSSAGRPAYGA